MSVLFVANRLEGIDAAIDTTVGLMQATQDLARTVWVTEATGLQLADGRPRAHAHRVELAASRPAGGCRWTVADPWFRVTSERDLWLDEVDAVFLRTDPPVNDSYLNATLVLDFAERSRTAVINAPGGLRACNEHLLPLRFPDLIPPTLVSADPGQLRAFVNTHTRCVIKPIDGHAGHGVFVLDTADPNLAALLATSTRSGHRIAMAQPYLPEVNAGNKRIFLLDGQIQAAVYRYPQRGDFRIGEPLEEAPVTNRDRHISERLAPTLAQHGLRMVGLDVIGPYLIEVNLTSPGALRKADALLGTDLCHSTVGRLLDAPAPTPVSTPLTRSAS